MESFLLEAFGLPLHPLVVHLAVVLIPVSALVALVGVIFYRRIPAVLAWGAGLSVLGALSGILATQSGEALGDEIGTPQPHGEWGEALETFSIVFAAVVVLTWWVRRSNWRIASILGTALIVLGTPTAIVLTVLVGHSGAEATWSGVLNRVDSIAPATGEEPASLATAPPGEAVYSLAEIAARNTPDNCWIAVDGIVYDVSGYAASHPGGEFNITQICGTDSTEAFRGEHGQDGEPNSTLARFAIGALG